MGQLTIGVHWNSVLASLDPLHKMDIHDQVTQSWNWIDKHYTALTKTVADHIWKDQWSLHVTTKNCDVTQLYHRRSKRFNIFKIYKTMTAKPDQIYTHNTKNIYKKEWVKTKVYKSCRKTSIQ